MRAGLLVLVCLLAGCAGRAPDLPVYGSIPPFKLTSQDGAEFDSRTLQGKVWVADFFFTSCMGPCPRMSSQMRWVQKQTAALSEVKFVSISVDPERDTPDVLAAYAKRFQAEPGRWYFLTGPQPVLHDLCRNAFKLGDVDGSLMHSTRFVLVDREARIRGYYHTDPSEGDNLKELVADLWRLAREGS
jgi:protein SCO1/2